MLIKCRPSARILSLIVAACAAGQAHAQATNPFARRDNAPAAFVAECGSFLVAGGRLPPNDYRKAAGTALLNNVESNHFPPEVEQLTRRATSPFGGDIDYLLHGFPNHPRGLSAMVRLSERERTDQPLGAGHTVECYLKRAILLYPDDHIVRMLYAEFLAKRKRPDEVRLQLEFVVAQAGDNAFTHYNAGLLYAMIQDYPSALKQAHRAMQLGFTRPGLKQRLVEAGKWEEPPQPSTAAESAAAASEARSDRPQ